MKKISQSVVAAIPFHSSISLQQQENVVEELDALQVKVGAVKRFQRETGVELDAMLPAILDRAFNGDLAATKAQNVAPSESAFEAYLSR
jgi:type I restriction enzyme S subunit